MGEGYGVAESACGGGYKEGCDVVYVAVGVEFGVYAVVLWVGKAGGGVGRCGLFDGDGGLVGCGVGEGGWGEWEVDAAVFGLVGVCVLFDGRDGVVEWVEYEGGGGGGEGEGGVRGGRCWRSGWSE